jgi:hypothetical protein
MTCENAKAVSPHQGLSDKFEQGEEIIFCKKFQCRCKEECKFFRGGK